MLTSFNVDEGNDETYTFYRGIRAMMTKLTLRLDDGVIRRAKRHAHRRGKSLSRMVGDYFSLMETPSHPLRFKEELTPLVKSLLGCAKGAKTDESDYRNYLIKKYS
jgi:hypothetical protein